MSSTQVLKLRTKIGLCSARLLLVFLYTKGSWKLGCWLKMACGLLQRVAALQRVSFAFLLIHIGVSVCFSSPATTEVMYIPKDVAENLVPRQAYAPVGKAQDDHILLPRRRIKDHSTTFRMWCAFIASWILAIAIGISTKRSLDKVSSEMSSPHGSPLHQVRSVSKFCMLRWRIIESSVRPGMPSALNT